MSSTTAFCSKLLNNDLPSKQKTPELVCLWVYSLSVFCSPKRELLDILFADFDGVSFHVSTQDPEKKNLVTVSMGWSCCSQLFNLGARQDLQKIYGPMLQATAEDKYDVSLLVDLDNPPEDPSMLALF